MKPNFTIHSRGPNRDRHHEQQNSQPDFTQDWRCQDCRKLLGKYNSDLMHIRRKPAEFTAGFPITAKCPGCGLLNIKSKA